MHLIHVLFGSGAGGCEKLCLTAVSTRIGAPQLFLSDASGPLFPALKDAASSVVAVPEPSFRRPTTVLGFAKALRDVATRSDSGIVLWHGRRNLVPTLLAVLLARYSGVVHVHVGTVVESLPSSERFYATALRLIDTVVSLDFIAPTDVVAESFREHYPRRHIRVVPNAVAVPRLAIDSADIETPTLRESGMRESRRRRVLSVGRFDDSKDQATLVQALQILRGRGVRLSVTLVGDGPHLEAVRQLALEGGVPINFTGGLSEPYSVAGQSDVFFFGTHPREGFGLALWEAIGAGMTVVASATPASLAAREQDGVYYYEYRDCDGLAEVLDRVTSEKYKARKASAVTTGEDMVSAYLVSPHSR